MADNFCFPALTSTVPNLYVLTGAQLARIALVSHAVSASTKSHIDYLPANRLVGSPSYLLLEAVVDGIEGENPEDTLRKRLDWIARLTDEDLHSKFSSEVEYKTGSIVHLLKKKKKNTYTITHISCDSIKQPGRPRRSQLVVKYKLFTASPSTESYKKIVRRVYSSVAEFLEDVRPVTTCTFPL